MKASTNWTSVIADLRAAGWTQSRVAAAVGISQPAVSGIAGGAEPRHSIGVALLELHRRVMRQVRNRAAEQSIKQAA